MSVARLRTIARVGGLLLFLILAGLLWFGKRMLEGLPAASGKRTRPVQLVGLREAEALERLLGEAVVHQRGQLRGDDAPELLASAKLETRSSAVVSERLVLLSPQAPGWVVSFNTSDPASWLLEPAHLQALLSALDVQDEQQAATALARTPLWQLHTLGLQQLGLTPYGSDGTPRGPQLELIWKPLCDCYTTRLAASAQAR